MNAKNVQVQARIDPELKKQADRLFQSMGMTTADAIRIFLQHSVNQNRIPFALTGKVPNQTTIAAMEELERGEGEVFTSSEEMYDVLGI